MNYDNEEGKDAPEELIKELFDYCKLTDDSSFEKHVESFLERNTNQQIWNYREGNQYTILHVIANRQIDYEHPDSFKVVEKIFNFISIHTHDKSLINFINCRTTIGFTAIHYASFRGNIYLMNLIAESGGNVFSKNKNGINIMHMAAQGSKTSLIFLNECWNHCAESFDYGGATPLHWACYIGNSETVDYLLLCKTRRKTDFEKQMEKELISASSSSSQKFNKSKNTSLFAEKRYICKCEERDKIEINVKDKKGITPLHLAALSGKIRIIKNLLQHGADKTLKDIAENGESAKTPYEYAQMKNNQRALNIISVDNISCLSYFGFKSSSKREKKSKKFVFIAIIMYIIILGISIILVIPDKNIIEGILKDKYFLIHFLLFIVSFILYLWLCCGCDPYIKIKEKKESNNFFKEIIENELEQKKNVNLSSYCGKCHIKREYLVKHCFICDKCVRNQDRHCYWFDKCIGERNYWLFYIFIIFTVLNLTYSIFYYIWYLLFKIKENTNKIMQTLLETKPVLYSIIGIILLFLIIFFIPIIYLLYILIRNIYHKFKNRNHYLVNKVASLSTESLI